MTDLQVEKDTVLLLEVDQGYNILTFYGPFSGKLSFDYKGIDGKDACEYFELNFFLKHVESKK